MISQLSHEETLMKISAEENARIDKLCSKRLSHIPIQYIIGEWDFRNCSLKMKPPIFIPRPETESLVDLVNLELERSQKLNFRLLEVGCGSGAISLSILREHVEKQEKSTSKPSNQLLEVVAIDVNEEAVNLTKLNSSILHLSNQLTVLNSSVDKFESTRKFDAIVSNPPYIPSTEMNALQKEIINHESSLALDGGKDGFDVIRQIISFADRSLIKDGWMWMEVDDSHPATIANILPHRYQLDQVERDLFDVERFVKLVKIR